MTTPSTDTALSPEPDPTDSAASAEELDLPALQPSTSRPLNGLRTSWDGVPMRARLVGILVVLLIGALTASGWTAQHVLHTFLISQVDVRLNSSAQQALTASQQGYGSQGSRPNFPTDYVVRFTADDGTRFPVGPPMSGTSEPDLPKLTNAQATKRGRTPFTVGSTTGERPWRVVVLPATYNAGDGSAPQSGSLALALPLDGVSNAVRHERWLILLIGLLVTLVCAALGWLAIRRAFLPLTEVEETAAAIAAGDLSRRVPDHPASTEVGRLTSSLNGMLAQIESAFRSREASEQRTRRFAADASHELRTPLASIRGFAELYRQGAVSQPEDVARTMSRIEDESRRMGSLVEDLLLLARLDEQRPARTDPVDLAVLAGDATHDARGLAPDRQVRLVGLAPGRGPEPSVVTGDENRLRQVVANLVGNAARHTPPGSPIELAVGRAAGLAVLEVRDHGAGLAPEHAAKVFERFYRVDASRARHQGGGSGLGLSIVTAVVSAHGGRVGVATTPGGGATFRVELPLASTTVAEDISDPD